MHRLSACTGVSVDKVLRIAVADVEKKARLVQVHELRVVIHAVKHLWVDWLRNSCREVGGLVAFGEVEAHTHCVRGHIELEHVPEDVAFRSMREPERG